MAGYKPCIMDESVILFLYSVKLVLYRFVPSFPPTILLAGCLL